MDKKGRLGLTVFLFAFLFLIFGAYLVFADHIVLTVNGFNTTNFNFDEDVSNLYNFSINITDVDQLTNITQVNLTIPGSFTFDGTNGTDSVNPVSFIVTSTVLSWENSTAYVVNGSSGREVNNFWVNLSVATPGEHILLITTLNDSGGQVTASNLYVTINDTTDPSEIELAPPTTFELGTLTLELANSTGVVNTSFIAFGASTTSGSYYLNYTGLEDEDYWFNATVNDTYGNFNDSLTYEVTVDTTDPSTIELATPTTANDSILAVNDILVNVTVADSNELDTVVIELGNSTGVVNTSSMKFAEDLMDGSYYLNFTGLTDEDYWFNATINDSAGNVNYSLTYTALVDTTAPPTMAYEDPTLGVFVNLSQSSIPVNVSALDAGSGLDAITINLYNSTNDLVGTAGAYFSEATTTQSLTSNFTGLEDGTYHFNATANDSVGNLNDSFVTRYVTLDNVEPAIVYDFPTIDTTQGWNYSQNSLTVNITATDGGAGLDTITIYLYNSTGLVNSTTSSTSPFLANFTSLPDELYYFNATVNDSAGNLNNTLATRSLTLDTLAPTSVAYGELTEVAYANLSQTSIQVNVTAQDAGVGLDTITINLYDAANTLLGSAPGVIGGSTSLVSLNYTFTGLGEGVYHFNATANDTVGNLNDSFVTRYVTLDTTDPSSVEFATFTESNNSLLARSDFIVNISAVDSVALARISITVYNSTDDIINYSSSAYGVASYLLNYTGLDDGLYTYIGTANDSASNSNSTALRTITLDSSAPSSIEFVSPSETDSLNISQSNIEVNVTAVDAATIDKIVVRLYNTTDLMNTSVGSSSPTYFNFLSLADGTYYFNATVNDTAANSNDSVTREVRLDATAPTVTLISPADSTANFNETIVFNYNVSDVTSAVDNCSLYLGGVLNQTNASITEDAVQNFTVYNISASDSLEWYVSCTDEVSNTGSATALTLDTYDNPAAAAAAATTTTTTTTSTSGSVGSLPSTGFSVAMDKGTRISFKVKGVSHKFFLKDTTSTSATIVIESDPITLVLNVGETKTVDTDANGMDDLSVTLERITYSGGAKVTMEEIDEVEKAEEVVAEEVVEEKITEPVAEGRKKIDGYDRNSVIGMTIVIVLALFGAVYYTYVYKKDKKKK